jgi:hypothetical protein
MVDLSKIGLKPFTRYWHHAESDSFFTTKGSEVPGEPADEITKAEYENGIAAQQAGTAAEAAPGPEDGGDSDSANPGGSDGSIAHVEQQKQGLPESTDLTSTYGPANFQHTLRQLDTLVGESTGIQQIQLDIARKYVMEIMVTLRTHPEFDGILVDKDIHNVMVFVQSSMNLATAGFVEKKAKAATRESKKKASSYGGMTFEMIEFGGNEVDAFKAAAASLDAFSTLNTDSIVPKVRK